MADLRARRESLCGGSLMYWGQRDIAVDRRWFRQPISLNHVSSVEEETKKINTKVVDEDLQLTGEFWRPSAERQSNVAPHKSIKVPSCSTFDSSLICNGKRQSISHSKKVEQRVECSLTGWPFCCADLDSRRLKTSPPKDVSRHNPHFAVPPQNFPLGCIIKTPFVVRPSISTLSCHFVAFSCENWKKKIVEIIVGKGQAMVKMENIQPKTT